MSNHASPDSGCKWSSPGGMSPPRLKLRCPQSMFHMQRIYLGTERLKIGGTSYKVLSYLGHFSPAPPLEFVSQSWEPPSACQSDCPAFSPSLRPSSYFRPREINETSDWFKVKQRFLTSISTLLPLPFGPVNDSISASKQSRLETADEPKIQELFLIDILHLNEMKKLFNSNVKIRKMFWYAGRSKKCRNVRQFWQKWSLTAKRSSPYMLWRIWLPYGLFRLHLRLMQCCTYL